jgi:hypothetical protein
MDLSRYKPRGAGKNHKLVPSKLSIASGNGKGKVRLLTREALDGRTRACKEFDSIVANIINDLGGDPSTIQHLEAEAIAGIAVSLRDLNARLKLGEQIDTAEQAQLSTTLVRVASRLPSDRVARDVTPTLGDIIRQDQERQRERLNEQRESEPVASDTS